MLLPLLGFEPGTSWLPAEHSNHCATLPLTAVLEPAYREISRVLQSGKDKVLDLKAILESTESFPKQAVALNQLNRILLPEEFISTGRSSVKSSSHFSMQGDLVYSFMAPVRSYLDLVVQRMLVAFVIEKSKDPYASDDDLRHIAHHCTRQVRNAKIYEKSVQRLSLALKLQKIPRFLPALVQSASEESLEFSYPYVDYLRASNRATYVPIRYLKPAKQPKEGDIRGKSIQLKWRNRVYSIDLPVVGKVSMERDTLSLFTDTLVNHVPIELWVKMIKIVKDQDYDDMEDLTEKWKTIGPSTYVRGEVMEVSCEKLATPEGSSEMKKYVEFKRQFHPGHVVELQLCSEVHHGIPEPKIQLVKLTPLYNICLEHRALPVECFTEIAEKLPAVSSSIEEYIVAWSPVLKMLIAHSTVMEDETILIHGVDIRWSKGSANTAGIFGHFTLNKKWCAERQIIFSSLPKNKGKSARDRQPDPSEEEPALVSDYICVRVGHYRLTEEDRSCLDQFECKQQGKKTTVSHPEDRTVVVHGLAGRVDITQTKDAQDHKIKFEVTQRSCELPDQLFTEAPVKCTVELIPKSEPMRRMETALADIEKSGKLIESIILQNPCSVIDELKPYLEAGRQEVSSAQFPMDFPPNESQKEAIRRALTQPFTVIQGPPGTGKTKTGALITSLFHKVNRRVSKQKKDGRRRQILYCGPSNKSVDVIARDLHLLKTKNLKFVRVYSDAIEQKEFPIPGVESAERKFKQNVQDPDGMIKQYALHRLIRTEAEKKGKQMKEMYKKLESGDVKPTIANIREYKQLAREAKAIVLAKKDVILCTCNAAGHSVLKENLNVVQCIIDEAGMCMELETIVPFASQKPKQVVLIGDHKQLRPIIQEQRVRQLGAEKSLMEKYEGSAHSLNIQYRMHEEICRFPSMQFYDGRLKTADEVKRASLYLPPVVWPGPDRHPRVFCHIEGVEESLTVRTAEGNEFSKSNEIEARETVRIAKYLLRDLGVNEENLVILSQYRLQCTKIIRRLRNDKVKVQTITKSQGSEWEFVILSTVRSLPEADIPETPGKAWRRQNLGFIEDENQMNVGLTRAKQGLIIVGNRNLLVTCKTWKKLIEHYQDTGSVVDAHTFLQAS